MAIFFYLIIFIFGLAIGSFLNCVIYRLAPHQNFGGGLGGRPRRKAVSFLRGRSFCPHCRHQLNWQDLIPLFSFFILKGKCRYCGQKISWQYPVVEISTALIFLLIFNFLPHQIFGGGFNQFSISNFQLLNFLYLLTIAAFLIIIFIYDLKHFIIPDKVIFPAIGIVFIYQIFRILNFGFVSDFGFRISDFKTLENPLFSAIFASLFFLAIFLISRGQWLGFGDVKLAFFMGLFLGYPNVLVALFFAFFLGAIIGVALIINKKRTFKSEIPFGPFLVAGTFVALFWGKAMVDWYMSLLI